MCRGYITKGLIYHTEDQIIGSGYQEACLKEKNDITVFKCKADEKGTPFVEVDPIVCNFIKNCEDKCVKEMFSRMVKSDGEAMALFPFQRLSHSFAISRSSDWNKEKKSNQNIRSLIKKMKNDMLKLVDKSNRSACMKAEHYVKALDTQLTICDETDQMIAKFRQNISKH